MKELSFSMVKPDGVTSGAIGTVIQKFEKGGLVLRALRMQTITKEQAKNLYGVHSHRPFFQDLVEYVTEGPVVLMVWEGKDVVPLIRSFIGATDPRLAEPGTIRALFGASKERNAIHASESLTDARREISIFFQESDLFFYHTTSA